MIVTYRSQDLEKSRWHLPSKLASCQGICTQRESKSPPSNVEGELLASQNRCRGKKEPNQPKCPEDQRRHEAQDVDGGNSGLVREDVGFYEDVSRSESKFHNTKELKVSQVSNATRNQQGRAYENAPDPKGPMGKKTLTMVSFGGSL